MAVGDRSVVVVGLSPWGPRECVAPPGPRIADSCGLWIVDVTPVRFDNRPAAAGKPQERLERLEGTFGFVVELVPQFPSLSIQVRISNY
jgi:hypothetical protein